jgi:GNAT superfamily N-acetyltransferase
MTPLIRPFQLDDAPAIARVHVDSWHTTYKGLLPDEMLASLSVERRETYWLGVMSEPDTPHFVYVAEVDGQVIGFASGGPERDNHPVYKGELYAIYLLEAYQGQGMGRALATTVVQRLLERGFANMLVWVLAGNPAERFYAALGGHEVRRKPLVMGDVSREEIGYGYDDLRSLVDSFA